MEISHAGASWWITWTDFFFWRNTWTDLATTSLYSVHLISKEMFGSSIDHSYSICVDLWLGSSTCADLSCNRRRLPWARRTRSGILSRTVPCRRCDLLLNLCTWKCHDLQWPPELSELAGTRLIAVKIIRELQSRVMQTCMGGHDQKSHGDGNYGAHELDPNPVDGCHGGELMQVCLTTFFF